MEMYNCSKKILSGPPLGRKIRDRTELNIPAFGFILVTLPIECVLLVSLSHYDDLHNLRSALLGHTFHNAVFSVGMVILLSRFEYKLAFVLETLYINACYK